jgi:hypothetical protein
MLGIPIWYRKVPGSKMARDWKLFFQIWKRFFSGKVTVNLLETRTIVRLRLAWANYNVTGFGFVPK